MIELKNMFEPITIGNVTIKNRFVVSPMVMNYCTADGRATETYIAYHEARAKGGWGLIITEDYAVDPAAKAFVGIGGLWDDSQIRRARGTHGASPQARSRHLLPRSITPGARPREASPAWTPSPRRRSAVPSPGRCPTR